jgi:hypothetical protein
MGKAGKGIVESVVEKKKKDGTPVYGIIIDGKEYYDSKGNFKNSKGQEVEFEYTDSQDGNITFINPPGGGFKGGSGGGPRGKSPEEIAMAKKTMALSYAKDQVNSLVQSTIHLLPTMPEGVKYLEFLPMMREAMLKMTEQTAKEFLKILNE